MSNYPILRSTLNPARTTRFDASLAAVEQAIKAGAIANPRYEELRQDLSRSVDDGFTAYAEKPFYGDREVPKEINYLSVMGLHDVLSAHKKVSKLVGKIDHPKLIAAKAFLDEVLPLAQAMNDLKAKRVKRQPKPVEDRREQYLAPRASGTAIAQVQALLMQITEESYEALLAGLVQQYQGQLDRFLAAAAAYVAPEGVRRSEPVLTPYSYATVSVQGGYTRLNGRLYEILMATTEQPPMERPYGTNTNPYRAKADAAEIIAAKSRQRADEMREYFVMKNLKKLDSIMEAKGGFDRAEIVGRVVSLGGLEGTLRFYFKDGAAFTSKIQVVYVTNSYGTEFIRTPITFHDVVLTGGVKMKGPSEKKMNTTFVGK